jgi:hypothetical protein
VRGFNKLVNTVWIRTEARQQPTRTRPSSSLVSSPAIFARDVSAMDDLPPGCMPPIHDASVLHTMCVAWLRHEGEAPSRVRVATAHWRTLTPCCTDSTVIEPGQPPNRTCHAPQFFLDKSAFYYPVPKRDQQNKSYSIHAQLKHWTGCCGVVDGVGVRLHAAAGHWWGSHRIAYVHSYSTSISSL